MRRAYAGLLLALSGCDPTRGLADTADAALPTVKRYFDGAGSRLAEGPWNRVVVDLDPDTLYHVGARRDDDAEPTFHLFGADAREGCAVTPNAGTWLMGKAQGSPSRLLPFVESLDERGRGRLRFTTLDCQVKDLVVEDAGRPYPRLYDNGYLVPTNQGYTFADPWSGESRVIADTLQGVLLWKDSVLFWADDELKSFSDEFEQGSEWGNAVAAVVGVKDAFLVEDADGLHHVTLAHDSLEITSEDVLPDACHLQQSSLVSGDAKGAWVVLQQPCGNPRPTLLHLDGETFETLDSFELPFEAEAQLARSLIAGPTETGEAQPLAVLYLTDVDAEGLGTLWAWQAGGDSILLGEHASLDSVYLEPAESDWTGVAQTNYQTLGKYLAHDWLHFRWDGTTEVIAERVIRNSSNGELIVNFDGVAGDLPRFDDAGGYRVLAKAVPPYSSPAVSYNAEQLFARVDEFDGASGRLLFITDGQDPDSWETLGSGVPPDSARFSWFMPALVFIENWDTDAKTGSLVAYNYDLDARTTIAEGVSSFDLTSYPWDGVVYAVPKGKHSGLWFSKAK